MQQNAHVYLDTPYYIVPRDQVGEETFAVIRDAMRGKDIAGMGRVVLNSLISPVRRAAWTLKFLPSDGAIGCDPRSISKSPD
jgi:hypothetical protein